jgi:hypothetical protein
MNTLPTSNTGPAYPPYFQQLPHTCFLPIRNRFISNDLRTLAKTTRGIPSKAKPRRNSGLHNRVRFNLHQHFRRNQLTDLHHARRRPDRSKELAMRPSDLLPISDVRHENPRPHHIFQSGARLRQRCFDIPDRLYRLRIHIADSDNPPVRPGRRRSRYAHPIPNPHRSRIPDDRLPLRTARNVLPRHKHLLRRPCVPQAHAKLDELWHAVPLFGSVGQPANFDVAATALGSAGVPPAVFSVGWEIYCAS